jgi:hypothetical protein
MSWDYLCIGFLQPVALGAAAVLVLLLVVSLGMPRRHLASASRKSEH